MILLVVNKKKYRLIEKWEEMTIATAIRVYSIERPATLKDLYEGKEIEITDEERIKIFPDYYGKVICELSNIEPEVMKGVFWEDRTVIYQKYCLSFIMGLMFIPNIEKEIEYFDFEGVRYYLPEYEKVFDKTLPMAKATAIEFTEASDLEIFSQELQGGRYERAANIISILCRPKNEKYNEKVCLQRAERFSNLTMDIVWGVFFCFSKLLIILEQNIQICFLEEQLREQKQLKKAV